MNALRHAASPYLLQHADDPVDWRPWGEDAFAEARRRDLPVLVSIGYASCHWCHVMQRESFRDEAIAQQVNERFVPVKVDREEHPDVDAVYMAALQAMRGQGGWPLTAIADHQGRPFFTGTYFPPDERPGMPSFPRVLAAVSDAWTERREALLADAERLEAHLRDGMAAPSGAWDEITPEHDLPDAGPDALTALGKAFDDEHGGFGDAPKFPPHAVLRWLSLRPEPEAHAMADATLRAIARGGISDPLAGGTARYAVDGAWRVPHFEKMLSDNVQLLPRWAEAWRRTGDATFLLAALRTFAWLEAEMVLPGGGYATALDADSEGEEGAFYAWTGSAFDAVVTERLGEEAVAFARAAYGVADVGPFEGRNVLRVAADPTELAARFQLAPAEAEARLGEVREALAQARAERPRPALDDKELTGMHGLAILGLARAGRLLDDARMTSRAQATAHHVLDKMVRPDGSLARRALGDAVGIEARLEDHAYLGLGLMELHRADGDARWLAEAERRVEAVMAEFVSEDGGFLSVGEDAAGPLSFRPRTLLDAAVPADSVAAAELVWRVSRLHDRPDGAAVARGVVAPLAEAGRRHPQAVASALTLIDLMRAEPRELAVTGPDDAGGRALWSVAARRPLDAWAVQRAREPQAGPLVEGRTTVDGAAAAWVCEGYACRLPVTEPDALSAILDDAARGAA